jgi:predicted methyltransferase
MGQSARLAGICKSCGAGLLILAMLSLLAGTAKVSAADHPFLAPPGPPAAAFPKADRPVADIISPIWHSEQERDAAGEPAQLVRWLGIKPGMTVADIGAGSGYYTIRLSPIVGPQGRILAQDIVPEYLDGLRKRVDEMRLQNITIARGEAHDPRLPASSIDLAILVHMYHEVAEPYALLYNLEAALKPGGRVGIVDTSHATSAHGTPPALLVCELAAVGYRQIGFHRLKGSDAYLAIFDLPPPDARKRPADIAPCNSRYIGKRATLWSRRKIDRDVKH